MFRAANVGRVWVPVALPSEEGEVTIHLLMELFTMNELRDRERAVLQRTGGQLLARAAEVKNMDDLVRVFDETTSITDEDRTAVLARTHDWKGIADPNGEAQAFTTEHLAALLAFRWVFSPVREALFKASREGVTKN